MAKYLVAASGDGPDSKISGRFGHAPYFIAIDPQTMDYHVYPGLSSEEENPGIQRFMHLGIDKVLVGNIGPSAFDDLKAHGLQAFLCRKMTIREAVEQVSRGEIAPMEGPTLGSSLHSPRKAGGHTSDEGHGHGSGGGKKEGPHRQESVPRKGGNPLHGGDPRFEDNSQPEGDRGSESGRHHVGDPGHESTPRKEGTPRHQEGRQRKDKLQGKSKGRGKATGGGRGRGSRRGRGKGKR